MVDCNKLHESMTSEEIQSVFSACADSVPNYDAVTISRTLPSSSERDNCKIRPYGLDLTISLAGKDMQIFLEETDRTLFNENIPVIAAIADKNSHFGIKYTGLQNVWPENLKAYQDVINGVAVVVETDVDGKLSLDGLIGYGTVIRSIPTRLRFRFEDSRVNYTNPHVVYKSNRTEQYELFEELDVSNKNVLFEPVVQLENNGKKNIEKNNSEKKLIDAVYPEIMVIVDYDVYAAHGKNPKALVKYMTAFWNAVDLRFRALENPKVRLNIAGIVIAMDEEASYYMKNHRSGEEDLADTLRSLSDYLHRDERFASKNMDFTVAFTNFNTCTAKDGICVSATQSISFVGGACKRNVDGSDSAVAVFVDKGKFDGVSLATHEIGHLLGLLHDTDQPNAKPSTEVLTHDRRSNTDRYIMSTKSGYSINSMRWSKCSMKAMQHFLNNEGFCLINDPKMTRHHPKHLLGKLLAREFSSST